MADQAAFFDVDGTLVRTNVVHACFYRNLDAGQVFEFSHLQLGWCCHILHSHEQTSVHVPIG